MKYTTNPKVLAFIRAEQRKREFERQHQLRLQQLARDLARFESKLAAKPVNIQHFTYNGAVLACLA